MITFDKIVKKLLKKSGNVMLKSDIFEIIDPEQKKSYQSKTDKTIYSLKAKGHIIPIKSGIYIIPSQEDKNLNKIDLIEKYYLKLLKRYILENCGTNYYISGNKALEIHDKNFSIPEKIFITTKDTNKKIIIGNYQIIFKTITGKKNEKNTNLFSKFKDFSEVKEIEDIKFKVSNLELSLVESCVLSDINEPLNIKLINKILKKYKNNFGIEIFYKIGEYKYIMSFNRLKELSKKIDEGLYTVFLDIVKKNGGLFIGEGLRGF
ncbi:hypothetical protein D8B46_04835 [Candidatus Gracilibacteria bacterium]|nr:MAG: hypothetical protein D8B46_04835 [Candidatus Gracilibacteria bacterium]